MAIVVNGTTLTAVNIGEINIKRVYARTGESGAYVLVFQGETTTMIYFAGNWKMNKVKSEIDSFFGMFNSDLQLNNQKKVIIFPPACYLEYVKSKIASNLSDMVEVGIQDISAYASGAYTGQISAKMAKDCGCTTALVGQSEVRAYLGDTNEICAQKILQAINNGLKVIYCVGEDLEEHNNGQMQSVINAQLSGAIDRQNFPQGNIIIAYEPLWAIGTGVASTPADLQNACMVIRQWIVNNVSGQAADATPILAGGSITPSNAQEIIAQLSINGGLVSGASLVADRFATIINEVIA